MFRGFGLVLAMAALFFRHLLAVFGFFFNDFGNYAQLIRNEAKLLAIFSEIFLLLLVRMVLVF